MRGVLPWMQVFSDMITGLCRETALRPPAKMFSYLKQALLDQGKKNTAINLAQKTDKLRLYLKILKFQFATGKHCPILAFDIYLYVYV
ncbi:hypothetical protein V6N13_108195 [Hibiscus sabdariffa]|uniref:Uncharacterized protein n=1 Tax=Hibiscus sabdariffa TaxID=183260 RepID=A0ABR2SSG4_9ROSI